MPLEEPWLKCLYWKLKRNSKLKSIEFSSPLKGYIPEPKPSLHFVPEAFKKMPGLLKTKDAYSTVKKCIPFLDAFTSGYIIPFQTDIEYIYDKEINEGKFDLNPAIPGEFVEHICVTSHHPSQIPESLMSPKKTLNTVLKFMNSWTIKTPPGYSCLFVTPFNHPLPFELITGVVDTDSYELSINFPFYWTGNPTEDFTLKQGSPMVMVIPFKREEWKMKCNMLSETQIKKESFHKLSFFSKVVDNYKKLAWTKKSYK